MGSIDNLNIGKCHTYSKKTLVFSIICSKYENKDEKIFKSVEPSEILKIIGLFRNI